LTTSSVERATSSRLAIAVVIGPIAAGRIVENNGRHGSERVVVLREERFELAARDRSFEPAEAHDEYELELGDDRPRDAHEQIVESTVLEVILDPRTADPPDPPVDHDGLPMVDVAEMAEVPARRSVGGQWS
jgi:hypothetical protein